MKFTSTFLALLILASCSRSQKKKWPEDTFYKLSVQKYDSLRKITKDSLSRTLKNVNDYSSLFTPLQIHQLDSIVTDYEKETNHTIVVITFDTTMASMDSTDEVTRIIAGKNKINTTIGIFVPYKKIYIWNDSLINNIYLKQYETKYIIDEYFLPSYAKGEYFAGTFNGLSELIKQIRLNKKLLPSK